MSKIVNKTKIKAKIGNKPKLTKMTKIYPTAIKLDAELYQGLKFLSDRTGRSQINILRSVIMPMVQVGASYETFNFTTYPDRNCVVSEFNGRHGLCLVSGSSGSGGFGSEEELLEFMAETAGKKESKGFGLKMSDETNGNSLSEIGQRKAEKIMNPEPDNVLKISLDTNQQVERLQAQLEEKTAKIAVMEYEKTHNSFGAPNAPKGGDTAPLNPPTDDFRPSRDNSSLVTKSYPNEFELYADLAKRSSEGDAEAQAIERQLLKNLRQNCGGLLDVSFYGDTHALYRQPKPITPNMTKEQIEYTRQKNAELMAEKAKWKRTEGV